MKSYSFSSNGLAKLQTRYLWLMGSFYAAIVCSAAVLVVSILPDNKLIAILATILIGVTYMLSSIRRGLKQTKEIWESIRIEVGDDYIARTQIRKPQVRIQRQEIIAIEESSASLCVLTNTKTRTLAISKTLDANDYKEIRDVLASWVTIGPPSKATKSRNLLYLLFSLLLMIAIGLFFFSSSLWLSLVSSVFLLASFGYYYWVLRQSQGVDPRVRRAILITLIVVLFMAAGKLIAYSSAFQTWIGSLSQ
jgi:hypothetical protein